MATQDIKMVSLVDYLDPQLIVFLDASSRNEALEILVERLYAAGKVRNKETFLKALLEREKIVSTGIGMGVAIPHAKLEEYSDFFIAVGIQTTRGIDWHALDSAPVQIIVMIGGPENRQTEYLQLLSHLTRIIKDETRRKNILKAKVPQEVALFLSGCV